MGYFTYIADQAFKEGEHGETLFFLGGPWSRPLVIGDDRKDATYRRHLWMQRLFLGTLIIGQPFLFMAIPEITSAILGFLTYVVSISLLYWVAKRFVFRRELQQCPRLDKRMPFRRFYQQVADRHSSEGLFLRFIGCMLFVAFGIWMLFDVSSGQRFIGLICGVLFSGFGLGWAYAWRLKSQTRIKSEQDGAGQPATHSESK
jgi:hypothetical protein